MDVDERNFIFSLGRIGKSLRRHFEAEAADLDITPPQFQVLYRLWRGDGILTSELAKEICLDTSTMTGLLDRLETKALVRRERSAEDRRAVRIFLTPAGSTLEEPLLAVLARVNAQALDGFTAEERAALLFTLDRVNRNLGADESGGP